MSKPTPPTAWKKGQSGNPAGRPKGCRDKATVLAEQLMQAKEQEVVQAVITAAEGGDMTAARLVLERIAPPRKGRPVVFELPPVQTAADIMAGASAIVAAVATGELTPEEAQAVAGVLDLSRRAIELVEIERRLAALEAKEASNGY